MATAEDVFRAVTGGDCALVEQLVTLEPALVNARNEDGVSAILWSAYLGRTDMVDVFLEGGAELDVWTAAALGQRERLHALLQEDTGLVRSYSADGWTPLHLAAFFGNLATCKYLLSQGAPCLAWSRNDMHNQPLHAAVASNQGKVVAELLAAGADVNSRQHGGWTPLHGAAQNGDPEVVELLISHGANAHSSNDSGQMPAEIAALAGNAGIATRLQAATSEGS
ncbi:MAG: ankyrin repeat domain-containing protein [Herpetosiphon sp.]